jgi:putative transposase
LGKLSQSIDLMMIKNSFPKIVKNILNPLPKNDDPVLNTRLYVECWLAYALDHSLTSMRDLFKRFNNTGIDVRISTFFKANTHRSKEIFQNMALASVLWRLRIDDYKTLTGQ